MHIVEFSRDIKRHLDQMMSLSIGNSSSDQEHQTNEESRFNDNAPNSRPVEPSAMNEVLALDSCDLQLMVRQFRLLNELIYF